MPIAGILGTPFQRIIPMTDSMTIAADDADVNLVYGLSGLSGGKTLTLPAISQMVASQNEFIQVSNASGSGGTITVAANAADAIIGATSVAAAAVGVRYFHDGLHTWFPA